MKKVFLSINAILLLFLSGCYDNPFTENKIFEQIKKIAFSEYHIDVTPQFNQDTLSILYFGKGLIKQTHSAKVKPTKKFTKISTNLFMLGKRTTESAEIKPKYYEMMVSSSEIKAPVQLKTVVMSDDISQFINTIIPHKEFTLRIAQQVMTNNFLMADLVISSIIATLKSKDTKKLQDMLLKKGETKSSNISHMFILYILENNFKDSLNIEILDMKKTPLKNNDIAVYLKFKDTYTLSPQNSNKKLIYPSGHIMDLLFILSNNAVKEIHLLDSAFKFPTHLKTYDDIKNWKDKPSYYTQKTDFIWFLKSVIKNRMLYNLNLLVYGDPMNAPVTEKLAPKKERKMIHLFLPNNGEMRYAYFQVRKFFNNIYTFITDSLLKDTPLYCFTKISDLVYTLNCIYINEDEYYLYNYHGFKFCLKTLKSPVLILTNYVYDKIKLIDDYIDNVNQKKNPVPTLFDVEVRSIIDKQVTIILKRTDNIANPERQKEWNTEKADKLSSEQMEKTALKTISEIDNLYNYGFSDILLLDIFNQNISSLKPKSNISATAAPAAS